MPATPLVERRFERKPLVFLSASDDDEAWRDGLRKRMSRYADYFEWWDGSKITPNGNLKDQLDAAIQRSSVAVVFLSRAYLSSDGIRWELSVLGELADEGQLTLFPILLEPCEWQQYQFLRNAQIW